MCGVNEEAGNNAVPLFPLPAEHIHELSGSHREVKLLRVYHLQDWAHVRHLDFHERICVLLQIVKVVDVGMYCELVDLFGSVQDEV